MSLPGLQVTLKQISNNQLSISRYSISKFIRNYWYLKVNFLVSENLFEISVVEIK